MCVCKEYLENLDSDSSFEPAAQRSGDEDIANTRNHLTTDIFIINNNEANQSMTTSTIPAASAAAHDGIRAEQSFRRKVFRPISHP